MITEKDIRLGKHIQKRRKELGLTQEELAEKTKLSLKYIQFVENAKSSFISAGLPI